MDTQEKLKAFTDEILKHGESLHRIKVARNYDTLEMSRLIFARFRLIG